MFLLNSYLYSATPSFFTTLLILAVIVESGDWRPGSVCAGKSCHWIEFVSQRKITR